MDVWLSTGLEQEIHRITPCFATKQGNTPILMEPIKKDKGENFKRFPLAKDELHTVD